MIFFIGNILPVPLNLEIFHLCPSWIFNKFESHATHDLSKSWEDWRFQAHDISETFAWSICSANWSSVEGHRVNNKLTLLCPLVSWEDLILVKSSGVSKSWTKLWIFYLGVSKNRGIPKWMVKIMENPIKMDDLGGFPLFLETPICLLVVSPRDFVCFLTFTITCFHRLMEKPHRLMEGAEEATCQALATKRSQHGFGMFIPPPKV